MVVVWKKERERRSKLRQSGISSLGWCLSSVGKGKNIPDESDLFYYNCILNLKQFFFYKIREKLNNY
jgi:hypothetical protein